MPESFLSISISVQRGELRRVARECTSTLEACLCAAYDKASASAGAGTGQTVSATSANAHSVSFSEPGKGSASPESYAGMWSGLLDLFYAVKGSLPDGSTDEEILVEMLFQLQPAKVYRSDYSLLRSA